MSWLPEPDCAPAVSTGREWSEQQKDIITEFETDVHNLESGDGNFVVRARAGTGKTTIIVEGSNHAPENRLLLCAFNKKIADELASRVASDRVECRTLHSVGYKYVREQWRNVSVEFGPKRSDMLAMEVCGAKVPEPVRKLVAKLCTKGREILPHAMKPGSLIDLAYTYECDPDLVWAKQGYDIDYVEDRALRAMVLAAEGKTAIIDGSDQIYLPIRNGWLRKEYDGVVVDEAQDMSNSQLEIALGVCRGRVGIVGDDRQAIYAFRGADSGSIDRLKRELDAKEFPLTTTYRCGKLIVQEAQRLVPDFVAGPDNADGTVTAINFDRLIETAQHGCFILSRVNAPLVPIAIRALKEGKRACVAGRDIGTGLKNLVRKLGVNVIKVSEFVKRVKTWEEAEVDRLLHADREDRVELVRDQSDMLISLTEDAKTMYDVTTRIDTLFTDNGLGAKGIITCSSVHKAKGLEADTVFVLRDTLYPGSKVKKGRAASDVKETRRREEENIEYVAITRAKQNLVWVEGL